MTGFFTQIEDTEEVRQGDIIRKRVAPGGAGVVLIPGILEATGIEAEAHVVVERVITAEIGDPGRVDLACVEGCETILHAAGVGLTHRVQPSAL